MLFEQIRVGGDRNFSYLVGDPETGSAVVVDPSFSPETVQARAEQHGLRIVAVLNTHGHYDHVNGNGFFRARGVPVVAHRLSGVKPQQRVEDGDELPIGKLTGKIIHTPGHTEDSICLLVQGELMTGDLLFVGKVGGTDFGTGARKEYDSLWQKVLTLPGEVRVWPGHDYGVQPSSTIAHELATNPFLLRTSFEDFVSLKRNWAEYKRIHGIK
jgi:glyoxylase-like metal-dependent hydrolase (beta-lactamase superfamily II)